MKNDNSSCSGDSDPLPHCQPDSSGPQVDLTRIIKSVQNHPSTSKCLIIKLNLPVQGLV